MRSSRLHTSVTIRRLVAVGFGIELLQQHRHLLIYIFKLAVTQQLASSLLHLLDCQACFLVTLGRLLCQPDCLSQVGLFP